MSSVINTADAAIELGLTKKRLLVVIKKCGIRVYLKRKNNDYAFSPDDIEEIREWHRQRDADRAFNRALEANIRKAEKEDAEGYWIDGVDLRKPSPPLPLEYLNDPAWHDAFAAERRRRELRLLALIRASGLKLGPRRVIPRGLDIDELDGEDAEPLTCEL